MYDDDVCGIEISSLPIDVWYRSMLYRYADILTGDRMIVGISNSVRLATGFGGFMSSHSLAPVMIPQIWVVTRMIYNGYMMIQRSDLNQNQIQRLEINHNGFLTIQRLF